MFVAADTDKDLARAPYVTRTPCDGGTSSAVADVLVIDSDEGSFGTLVPALQDAGHAVRVARTGAGGLVASRGQRPDLVLLEALLPDISGMEVCRSLKSDDATQEACVIFLSSKNGDSDRVTALELGADDYVAKPFNPRELAARISAILRRSGWQSDNKNGLRPPKIKFGDLELDLGARTVSKAGAPLNLTSAEFELLHMFFEFPGQVLTRDKLVERVLDRKFSPFDRSIDFHITNLRRKLGPQPDGGERIRSVRAIGYLYAWPGKKAD
jgi:DNA-binding response OmpR family regulator